jgi:hypothetical protein
MRCAVRFLVFGACLVTLWLVALPALADGPACDDRGATVVAPSPALVEVLPGLEAGDVDELIGLGGVAPAVMPQPPQAPTVSSSSTALIPAVVAALPCADSARLGLESEKVPTPSGVKSRVDRPPRG